MRGVGVFFLGGGGGGASSLGQMAAPSMVAGIARATVLVFIASQSSKQKLVTGQGLFARKALG